MEFHEAAGIFPLDEEHLDDLAADIREQGLQVPIELLDGKILDGRRRWLACQRVGIRPSFREVSPADAVAYVWSLNGPRRHCTPSQLAMVGARMREMYDRQAKERLRQAASRGGQASGSARRGETKAVANLPQPSPGDKARDQVGLAVGVSGKSIDNATKVLERGSPKLIAAVDADQVAVSTAARAATLSGAEQDALAERAAEEASMGRRRRRPVTEGAPGAGEPAREVKGKGIEAAYEAINILSRIPKDDPFRKRGFQIVADWLRNARKVSP